MNRYIPINLKAYYNHKMVYKQLPKGNRKNEFGLDNICILKSDVKLKEQEILEGVEFNFSFGKFDNIVCDRQKIIINAKATKLHLIGFAYWGDTNEYFKVIYDDLTQEIIKIPFIDWSHKPYRDSRSIDWYGENTSTVRTVIVSGELTHLVYFHHTVCEIMQRKTIKEIVLPDNMLTHIFAITLENESKNKENTNKGEEKWEQSN